MPTAVSHAGAAPVTRMSEPILRMRDVGKSFGDRSRTMAALVNFSLDVARGEFICVLGASGCGKSTLLKLIAGLSVPTTGTVERSELVSRPGGIGMVFQSPVLLPWRTAFNNVMAPSELLPLAADPASKARELLRKVGLGGFEHSFPHQLSGGMQQRVSIARALLSDPPLLLMDEPFGALDALTREQMNLDLLKMWADTNKTILLVTHSIEEAAFLASRIVVMAPRPGRIAEVVDSPLPRERSLDTMVSPEFVELSDFLRRRVRAVSAGELGTADVH